MTEKLAPYLIMEGGSMSGKTTQSKLLLPKLLEEGEWQMVREPGGTIFGSEMRHAVQRPDRPEQVHPLAEFFAYSADRTQLAREVIWPALKRGVGVLSDRCWFSSYAFQGQKVAKSFIVDISHEATDNLKPTLVLYYDLLPELAQERMKAKLDLDIHDLKDLDFKRRVRDNYLELATLYPEVWVTIDASQSIDKIFHDTLLVLETHDILPFN